MPNQSKWYLQQTTRAIDEIAVQKLGKFVDIVEEECQKGAPGRIEVKAERARRRRKRVTVKATHPENPMVPIYIEFGTQPHTITPKTKKVLRWVDEGGDEHFATKVYHPGTAPNPFMRRGISRAVFRVQEAFR